MLKYSFLKFRRIRNRNSRSHCNFLIPKNGHEMWFYVFLWFWNFIEDFGNINFIIIMVIHESLFVRYLKKKISKMFSLTRVCANFHWWIPKIYIFCKAKPVKSINLYWNDFVRWLSFEKKIRKIILDHFPSFQSDFKILFLKLWFIDNSKSGVKRVCFMLILRNKTYLKSSLKTRVPVLLSLRVYIPTWVCVVWKSEQQAWFPHTRIANK